MLLFARRQRSAVGARRIVVGDACWSVHSPRASRLSANLQLHVLHIGHFMSGVEGGFSRIHTGKPNGRLLVIPLFLTLHPLRR